MVVAKAKELVAAVSLIGFSLITSLGLSGLAQEESPKINLDNKEE